MVRYQGLAASLADPVKRNIVVDKEAIEFIRSALPSGRTVFYDFQDRFAILLLSQRLKHSALSVAEIKKSNLAPLLSKPVVKTLLSQLGRPVIAVDDLLDCWPTQVDAYRLTLDTWPSSDVKPKRSAHQVTRLGYSLVLQLNLPVSHTRELAHSIEDWQDYTSSGFHPVAKSNELTLGWARIDLDFSKNEALIEEIQSDWIRDVKYYAGSNWIDNQTEWKSYYSNYLAPKAKHWPRTILTATLWFLLEELGIQTIFFHTHESGSRLKQIKYNAPPRSIYTDLPRTFCFRTTHNGPMFLRDSRDRYVKALFTDPDTKWFMHDFSSQRI